jgi:glycosyltransferase involved in cell wall biosynthesis
MDGSSRTASTVVAYLTNEFPAAVEPYVEDEIRELTRRGILVIPCSVKRPAGECSDPLTSETQYLQPWSPRLLLKAFGLCVKHRDLLRPFLRRALGGGCESVGARLRAVLHTWIGAYFALLLKRHSVLHVHVHHGYAAAWIAMVAARILRINFSLTLHGSDLLVDGRFMDIKLENCRRCFTVSEYNRAFLGAHYPQIDSHKVLLRRMGVPLPGRPRLAQSHETGRSGFVILAVGRLHPVKDHAFLILACAQLKALGSTFLCLIAGEGPERRPLERLIRSYGVEKEVQLLGHVRRNELDSYYAQADLVVLTSRSEGIPLTLMEAMALGKPVLAPAITGIPELVIAGQTGFLYEPGSLEDFVFHVETIRRATSGLDQIRRAAREHVRTYFERDTNLKKFADLLLEQIIRPEQNCQHENSLHQ